MDTRIRQIGFFHFVKDFDTPIEALDVEIERERHHAGGDISGSLIVLPEAFNGRDYSLQVRELPPDKILWQLQLKFAAPLDVAFVVGILGGHYNSAYWVDSDGPCRRCHKTGDDNTHNYCPCEQGMDPRNPVTRGSARIGALICMDSTEDDGGRVRDRRRLLLAQLKDDGRESILCVPGRFGTAKPDPSIPGCWFVVANGKALNGSFVADASGNVVVNSEATPWENQVRLWPLPEAR
jgi:hypothetical protein